MTVQRDLDIRFGPEAASAVSQLIGNPPTGEQPVQPAEPGRCRGALMGAAIGEALGEPVEDRGRSWIANHVGRINSYLVPSPRTGSDTQLTLMTADSVLASVVDHPALFAARLAGASIDTRGIAVRYAQSAIRNSQPWWKAAKRDSAGTSGAARCAAIGLVWAGDPRRAAYEAALSTSVTHGHPVATAAAAAFASAVALAARGNSPLDESWLQSVTDICADFNQGDVGGVTVVDRLQLLPMMIGQPVESALDMIGTGPIAIQAVPAALWCVAAHPDPVEGLLAAVNAGGDTDTIAAMAGACYGARYGDSVWPVTLTNLVGIDETVVVGNRIGEQTASPPQRATVTSASDAPASDAPVHVSFLLDRSGSMNRLVDDVVGGFNAFVANQRATAGDCAFTTVQFDSHDPFEVIHNAVPISTVPELSHDQYRPRGMTPLLDALGNLVTSTEQRVNSLSTAEDQVVVVFTDGLENASRTWNRNALFDVIEKKKADGWSFVFMGANQDAYDEAGALGFDTRNIQNYRGDQRGTREAWGSVDRAVRGYRQSGWDERRRRKDDLFKGTKEAERDHLTR